MKLNMHICVFQKDSSDEPELPQLIQEDPVLSLAYLQDISGCWKPSDSLRKILGLSKDAFTNSASKNSEFGEIPFYDYTLINHVTGFKLLN